MAALGFLPASAPRVCGRNGRFTIRVCSNRVCSVAAFQVGIRNLKGWVGESPYTPQLRSATGASELCFLPTV